jgi:hypothetical protein
MFAQLMSEMLNPSTFESFRVYSLDTTARLHEALELIDDVRRSRIPPAVLIPVAEELEWSFSKDSAARSLAVNEIESLFKNIKDRKNLNIDGFLSHIKLIKKLIDEKYKNKIEDLILEIFDDPNRRMELRKLSGFYCSHLVNIGYMRQHVINLVNSYFFDRPLQRIGRTTLAKFFREFDGKKKRFIVHASVTNDLGIYLKGIGFQVRNIDSLSADQIVSLSVNSNIGITPLALEINTDNFDAHGAMNFCYQMLSSQRAIAYLDPFGMNCEWGNTMHISRARAVSGGPITKGDFLLNRTQKKVPSSGNRLRSIRNYSKSIITNFDENSTERLISSINTAALARTSVNPENQLISFWSAIEVLLSEPRDQARIVHYASLITPCITLRHTRRQFSSVYDELLISYKSRFRRLLRRVAPTPFGPRAFAELILLQNNSNFQAELFSLIDENPLARHRVWKLRHDYQNVKSAHRTLSDHQDRVKWQIHRIYRARNQLVHSGRMPSYLESIILNLAEYYRSSIATVINRAKIEEKKSDIDQIVAEIGIRYEIFRSQFDKKNPAEQLITPDHVAMLMDTA